MTIPLQVLFRVPEEIARGLAEGRYVRKGGVICRTDSHEVVAWLREIGEKQPGGAGLPDPGFGPLPCISLGVQVLSLGVMVVGFKMVLERLALLQEAIDGMRDQVGRIADDVDWILRHQAISHSSALIAAIQHAEWAESSGRTDQLADSLRPVREAAISYRTLLHELVTTRRAYGSPGLYQAYVGHWFLAAQGQIQIQCALDGPAAARSTCQSLAVAAPGILQEYCAPLKTFDRDLFNRIQPLAYDDLGVARDSITMLKEGAGRLQGYAAEFAFCVSRRIPLASWYELDLDGASTDSRIVAMIPKGASWVTNPDRIVNVRQTPEKRGARSRPRTVRVAKSRARKSSDNQAATARRPTRKR